MRVTEGVIVGPVSCEAGFKGKGCYALDLDIYGIFLLDCTVLPQFSLLWLFRLAGSPPPLCKETPITPGASKL